MKISAKEEYGLRCLLQLARAEILGESLTLSQLFYFVPGWIYIFGVGVLGGTVLRESQRTDSSSRVDKTQ